MQTISIHKLANVADFHISILDCNNLLLHNDILVDDLFGEFEGGDVQHVDIADLRADQELLAVVRQTAYWDALHTTETETQTVSNVNKYYQL